jgi:hypothetical protein
MSYDRYQKFRNNGTIGIVPGIKLTVKPTDEYVQYELNKSRLDLISYEYYGDANYDWLIMLANPQFGSLEYMIPDGEIIRVPFPLSDTIKDYEYQIEKYNKLYK